MTYANENVARDGILLSIKRELANCPGDPTPYRVLADRYDELGDQANANICRYKADFVSVLNGEDEDVLLQHEYIFAPHGKWYFDMIRYMPRLAWEHYLNDGLNIDRHYSTSIRPPGNLLYEGRLMRSIYIASPYLWMHSESKLYYDPGSPRNPPPLGYLFQPISEVTFPPRETVRATVRDIRDDYPYITFPDLGIATRPGFAFKVEEVDASITRGLPLQLKMSCPLWPRITFNLNIGRFLP